MGNQTRSTLLGARLAAAELTARSGVQVDVREFVGGAMWRNPTRPRRSPFMATGAGFFQVSMNGD
jgi:hypothetical protein